MHYLSCAANIYGGRHSRLVACRKRILTFYAHQARISGSGRHFHELQTGFRSDRRVAKAHASGLPTAPEKLTTKASTWTEDFEADLRGFGSCCLRINAFVTYGAQGSLPAGGQPLPDRLGYPQDATRRFPIRHIHGSAISSPFPRLCRARSKSMRSLPNAAVQFYLTGRLTKHLARDKLE